jgi:hypothetical protein
MHFYCYSIIDRQTSLSACKSEHSWKYCRKNIRVRRMRKGRNPLGCSEDVPKLRSRWMLWLIDRIARNQALSENPPPCDGSPPEQILEMVLYWQGVHPLGIANLIIKHLKWGCLFRRQTVVINRTSPVGLQDVKFYKLKNISHNICDFFERPTTKSLFSSKHCLHWRPVLGKTALPV